LSKTKNIVIITCNEAESCRFIWIELNWFDEYWYLRDGGMATLKAKEPPTHSFSFSSRGSCFFLIYNNINQNIEMYHVTRFRHIITPSTSLRLSRKFAMDAGKEGRIPHPNFFLIMILTIFVFLNFKEKRLVTKKHLIPLPKNLLLMESFLTFFVCKQSQFSTKANIICICIIFIPTLYNYNLYVTSTLLKGSEADMWLHLITFILSNYYW